MAEWGEGMIPLGIIPEKLWKEARLHELLQAMERYETANIEIPIEWLDEYRRLSTEILFSTGRGD